LHERQASDVDRPRDEYVGDLRKLEWWASSFSLASQIRVVARRNVGQFLIGDRVED
jgi:hypothetical protein